MYVTLDRKGRLVVVVADEQWEAMDQARRIGWHELPGFRIGESAPVDPTSDLDTLLAAICAAILALPEAGRADREQAERGGCSAFITSDSRWSAENRWFAPGESTLCVVFGRRSTDDPRFFFWG